jgi:hypothetical protein
VQVFALSNGSDLRLYTTLNILDIAGIGGGINKQLNCGAEHTVGFVRQMMLHFRCIGSNY